MLGAALDARANVFAIGCVMYELFTGARAFGARPGTSPLTAVFEETPPQLHALRHDVPRSLESIVCFGRSPNQRSVSARKRVK